MGIHNSSMYVHNYTLAIMEIHNSIRDIHNWTMDIIIQLWISIIIMNIHNWMMDIHNYKVYALLAFHIDEQNEYHSTTLLIEFNQERHIFRLWWTW